MLGLRDVVKKKWRPFLTSLSKNILQKLVTTKTVFKTKTFFAKPRLVIPSRGAPRVPLFDPAVVISENASHVLYIYRYLSCTSAPYNISSDTSSNCFCSEISFWPRHFRKMKRDKNKYDICFERRLTVDQGLISEFLDFAI